MGILKKTKKTFFLSKMAENERFLLKNSRVSADRSKATAAPSCKQTVSRPRKRGLARLGVARLGSAWCCVAWLGRAWSECGWAWLGLAWLGSAWPQT